MTENILTYEEAIERSSCYAPEGCGNIPWPVGVPPSFKPPTRFDVLRWDYFNQTHIYLKTDNDVINLMKGLFLKFNLIFLYSFSLKDDDYEDINEVINHSIQQLQKKYGTK